jgi:hypothetical protein
VVAELVAALGELAEERRVGGPGRIGRIGVIGILADDEPGDGDATSGEQPGGAWQRARQDDVLELDRVRAEAVNAVVATDGVEIDRDRAALQGLPPKRMT